MTAFIPSIKQTQRSLFQYINEINRIPMLTAEEEIEYAQLKDKGNLNAIKMLVSSHLKLVVKIAFNYKNYQLPIADLISEGNIGLMRAVKNFKLNKGCRFATYATWWIKAYIQDYILKTWSLIKIGTTSAQKKLFFSLRKIKNKILSYNQKHLTDQNIKEIAKECDVNVSDVIEMDSRLSSDEISLNAKVSDSEGKIEVLDLVEAEQENQEEIVNANREKEKQREMFKLGMKNLSERERDIIYNRKILGVKLIDLSEKYNISKERIRQIEDKALKKLKEFIENYSKSKI
jgi:RNA polymerase sigma-32 factor